MPHTAPQTRSTVPNRSSDGGMWLLQALISAICGFAGLLLGIEILVAGSLIWSLMTCTRLSRKRLITETYPCTMDSARLASHEISSWTCMPKTGAFWACTHFHRLITLNDGTLRHVNDLRALIHPEDLRTFDLPRKVAHTIEVRIRTADERWQKISMSRCDGFVTSDDMIFGTATTISTTPDVSKNSATPLESGALTLEVTAEKSNDKAAEKIQARNEFISNLTHEIRSPLTAILGFTEMLDTADTKDREKFIRTIQRNGEYLLRLIDDTLHLSKSEAGEIQLEICRANPARILQEIRDLNMLEAQRKELELRFDCDGSTPDFVHIDPTRFRQILSNLVSNSIRFTSKGFISARLSYDEKTNELLCEVRDSGIGIPEKALTKIFEPFQQAEKTTNRTYGGTGLGLHISRKLARLMGGDIDVRSRVGFGSSFTARILCSPAAPSCGISSATTDSKSIVGHVVLLADDGADNRRLISHLLKKAGACVIETANGREALDAMRLESAAQRAVDLVILDMQMPVMDGYETARQMRKEGCEIPILALTAKTLQGDRDACLQSGCDHYLPKPIQTRNFLSEITALLHQQTVKQRAG